MTLILKRIFKDKTVSVISLSVAVAACLLIVWLISFHLGFDRMHDNRDRIYRVSMNILTSGAEDHYAATGGLLGQDLVRDYPVFTDYVSFRMWDGPGQLTSPGEKYEGYKIYSVSPSIFSVFSYELLEGTTSALNRPYSVVLTRKVATTLFGDDPALSQTLQIDGSNYTVTGIMEDLPANSDLQFDVLTSADGNPAEDGILQSFFNIDHYIYVLAGNDSPDAVGEALKDYADNYLNPMLADAGAGFDVAFAATSLSNLHFSEALQMDSPKGSLKEIYLLGILAILLLIIGTANYLNSVLTSGFRKATKIGIQRVFGVSRRTIYREFITESIWVTGTSLLIAMGIVFLCIRNAEIFSSYRYFPDAYQVFVFAGIIALLIFSIGTAGGILPAARMFRKKSAALLREKSSLISYNAWHQRLIMFLQFSISFALIAGTIELNREYKFFSEHYPGFDKERVLVVNVPDGKNNRKMEVFRNMLLENPDIEGVAMSRVVPGDVAGQEIFSLSAPGESGEMVFNYQRVDEQYFNVLGIPLTEGRIFDLPSDRDAVLVNQTFASRYPGIEMADLRLEMDTVKEIIGQVRDHHQLSFHNPIEPMIFGKLDPDNDHIDRILIRSSSPDIDEISRKWKSAGMEETMTYTFLDDHFNAQYENESTLMQLFIICSAIALLLSITGLYNLIAVVLMNRKKELAIRQVLGSSLRNIFLLISGPFLVLTVVVACVVVPLLYYFSLEWRATFVYLPDQSLLPVIFAALFVLFIIGLVGVIHVWRYAKLSVVHLIKEE